MNLRNLTLALVSFASATALAGEPAPAPAPAPPSNPIWSNTVTCGLNSMVYFNFSEAQPFHEVFGWSASGDTISFPVDATVVAGNTYSGQVQIPGTDAILEARNVDFFNDATHDKLLSEQFVLRQNGVVISAAGLLPVSAKATYAELDATLSLASPESVVANERYAAAQRAGIKNKSLQEFFRDIATEEKKTIVIDRALVYCKASRQ